jgi:hypothetical protein
MGDSFGFSMISSHGSAPEIESQAHGNQVVAMGKKSPGRKNGSLARLLP